MNELIKVQCYPDAFKSNGKRKWERKKNKAATILTIIKVLFVCFLKKERKTERKKKERKKQYKIINSANQQLCKSENAVRRLIIQQMLSCNPSTTTLYITLMVDWALKIYYLSAIKKIYKK